MNKDEQKHEERKMGSAEGRGMKNDVNKKINARLHRSLRVAKAAIWPTQEDGDGWEGKDTLEG